MFPGLVGRVIETFAPYTEASDVAIGAQFVVAFGNAVGRGPHFLLGETIHRANESLVVAGPTAVGRKGDAGDVALAPFRGVDDSWLEMSGPGLSSGEGLINCVRDPISRLKDDGTAQVIDEGVIDKRFLAIEAEFAALLKMFTREGNTLSNVMREAWDGREVLRVRTKSSALRATGAHVSVIGHSTPEDLQRYLADVEIANGTANRFIFVYVSRARLLPSPGRAPDAARGALRAELTTALQRARGIGEVRFAPDTEAAFAAVYEDLSRHRPGLLGALLERAPAHVRRLALIYALLDGRDVVAPRHLESALAFWEVSEASAELIFKGRSGSDTLDRLLAEMVPGQRLSLEAIRRTVFNGHVSASKLRDAIALGTQLGVLSMETQTGTGGRDATVVERLTDRSEQEAPMAGAA